MKRLMSIIILLAFTFLFFGCNESPENIMSANTDKGGLVPFKGNWEGMTYATSETGRHVTCNGNSTHLGLFTADVMYDVTYNGIPPTGGTLINGTATMIAANGDKVYLGNLTGDWWFSEFAPEGYPTMVAFNCTGSVTGGTGRFAGATGNLSGTGTQKFYYFELQRPQEVWFNWTGKIKY